MKNQAHCSSHIHHKLCLAASFPLVLKHIFSYQLLCSILLKMHRVQIRFFSRGARHHQLPPEICLLSPPPTFPSCHYDSSVILSPSHQPKCLRGVQCTCALRECIWECIRTLPRGGMYWEIHPPRPERFPKGGDFAPRGPERFPGGEARGKSRWLRGMYFPMHPDSRQCTSILSAFAGKYCFCGVFFI